ncbi:hypothetical protein T459_10238 [Capsicum annuum]|uniref:Uncharacterized protein n=1 Tax=Capsicum annuum TaxID=4072 RepID=A0A2G3A1N1_CAPAN|nr:hypothetical protein T459_10238 [Capsicum annuum]
MDCLVLVKLLEPETRGHRIHSKKRNRLELSRLNDLVYIKYNRTMARCYDIRDAIDPIMLENIEDANEWLLVGPEDQEDELVFEEGDLNWGTVAMTVGADDDIVYDLRRKSRSRSFDKGKATSSSQTWVLVDEESEEEEDEGQYNELHVGIEDYANLEEE